MPSLFSHLRIRCSPRHRSHSNTNRFTSSSSSSSLLVGKQFWVLAVAFILIAVLLSPSPSRMLSSHREDGMRFVSSGMLSFASAENTTVATTSENATTGSASTTIAETSSTVAETSSSTAPVTSSSESTSVAPTSTETVVTTTSVSTTSGIASSPSSSSASDTALSSSSSVITSTPPASGTPLPSSLSSTAVVVTTTVPATTTDGSGGSTPPTSATTEAPADLIKSSSLSPAVVGISVVVLIVLFALSFYFVVMWPRTSMRKYRRSFETQDNTDQKEVKLYQLRSKAGGGNANDDNDNDGEGGGGGGYSAPYRGDADITHVAHTLYGGAPLKRKAGDGTLHKIPTFRDIEAAAAGGADYREL